LGDSIRRTIDKGLGRSRYGIVVLSAAFFAKQWTQYELDGLVEAEMAKKEKAILPLWHGVSYQQVFAYSPALASRKAAMTANGLDTVLSEILRIVRPEKDPIVVASNVLERHSVLAPPTNDKRWVDIIATSTRFHDSWRNRQRHSRTPDPSPWTFPIEPNDDSPEQLGQSLAWTVMQSEWIHAAKAKNVGPTSAPEEAWEFIEQSRGLLEQCNSHPSLVAAYAPQLTIRGLEKGLASSIDTAYREAGGDGTVLHDDLCPLTDDLWHIRCASLTLKKHAGLCDKYFRYSTHSAFERLIWLLASDSGWLPENIRQMMLKGASKNPRWLRYDLGLEDEIIEAIDQKRELCWTTQLDEQLITRIGVTVRVMCLRDKSDVISEQFKLHHVPEMLLESERAVWPNGVDLANW
jgi:hypothetical protein